MIKERIFLSLLKIFEKLLYNDYYGFIWKISVLVNKFSFFCNDKIRRGQLYYFVS